MRRRGFVQIGVNAKASSDGESEEALQNWCVVRLLYHLPRCDDAQARISTNPKLLNFHELDLWTVAKASSGANPLPFLMTFVNEQCAKLATRTHFCKLECEKLKNF